MSNQRTIARRVDYTGRGIHTNVEARIVFGPAEADAGVVFVRTDLPGSPRIPVCFSSVADAVRRTKVVGGDGGEASVETVEHLLAALYGLSIDNLVIEIDAGEVPGTDGSAAPYADLLERAGIVELPAQRLPIRVRKPIWIGGDDAYIGVLPADELRVSYTLDYPQPGIGAQYASMVLDEAAMRREILPARTFCAEEEVALQAPGMGAGATKENTVVVGPEGPLYGKLRYPDEYVRHKILDLLGDLFLAGGAVLGHIVAVKSGHALNRELVRSIIAQPGTDLTPPVAIEGVMGVLPHRYPFLLVDRILEIEYGVRAVGLKNVTANEPFFRGHFPGLPIMPGVLLIEAMAQTGGVAILGKPENFERLAYLAGVDKARMRRPVVPGDQVIMEATVVQARRNMGRVRTVARVDGVVVAEAELMFAMAET